MKDLFLRMLGHMQWADRRIGETLAAAETPPPETVKLYAHIVSAERNWLSRLEGGAPFVVPVFPDWPLPEAAAASAAVLADYERWLGTADDFGRICVYKNSSGAEFRTSVADILTHVFLHGSHHRGQINTRLRGAGLEPVGVDFILFSREA